MGQDGRGKRAFDSRFGVLFKMPHHLIDLLVVLPNGGVQNKHSRYVQRHQAMTKSPVSRSLRSTEVETGKPEKLAASGIIHFYQNGHIATEVSNQGNRQILWAQDTPVAHLERSQQISLLPIDRANSILGMPLEAISLSPYGYLPPQKIRTMILFNGQRRDPLSQMDILGNGYRPFSTTIRRFCTPDVLQSPFGDGGTNPYAYCENDPINKTDSSGQASNWIISGLKGLGNALGFRTPSRNRPNMPTRPARAANNDYSSGSVRRPNRPNEGRPLPPPPAGGRLAESRSNNRSGIGYSSQNDLNQADHLSNMLSTVGNRLQVLGNQRTHLRSAISRQTRIGNTPTHEKKSLSAVNSEIKLETIKYNQINDQMKKLRTEN